MPDTIETPRLFPIAFGNEAERDMKVRVGKEVLESKRIIGTILDGSVPNEYIGHGEFLNNAFRLYNAGNSTGLIEVATPECSTPVQLRRYIRAGDHLLHLILSQYAVKMSLKGASTKVRAQNRVIDDHNHTRGCHDNFGYKPSEFVRDQYSNLPGSVLRYLGTRHFISGAGLNSPVDGLRYAQKIDGLTEVKGYGYKNTMYRIDQGFGSPRIEIRCNDINISDWATKMRIGSTAIMLALAQTPLADQLFNGDSEDDDRVIAQAQDANGLNLTADGTIKPSAADYASVDYQQLLFELALNELSRFTDVPDEYLDYALQGYEYCEDFRKVLGGNATIELLADRADWAAKFHATLRKIQKDSERGADRHIHDKTSRDQDLLYDITLLHAEGGKIVSARQGLGYRLRETGHMGDFVSQDEIESALNQAPQTTRARLRAHVLSRYVIQKCDWHYVEAMVEGIKHRIELSDVTQTEFTDYDLDLLMGAELKKSVSAAA